MAVNEFHIIDACIGLDCKNPTRKPSAKNPQTGRKNPQTGAIFFSARFVVLMCTIHDVWVQLLSILVQGALRLVHGICLKTTLETGHGLLRMQTTDSTKTLDDQIQALIIHA